MKKRASDFLKMELKKRKITYNKLSSLMEERGYIYSANTIRSKVNRGSFSFVFFLEVCDTLNIELSCLDNSKSHI